MKNIVLAILTVFIAGCTCTQKQYNVDSHKKISKDCRIGITTRPDERYKEWKRYYEKQGKKIISWTILSKHFIRNYAQQMETKIAKEQNCVSSSGGRNPKIALWWFVYKLEYESK